jgi:hypothetical protein
MGVIAGVNAVNDGLICTIDAANFRSYSGPGNTANSGSFIFDDTNDYIDVPINPS